MFIVIEDYFITVEPSLVAINTRAPPGLIFPDILDKAFAVYNVGERAVTLIHAHDLLVID
jgi:hypothetical protein